MLGLVWLGGKIHFVILPGLNWLWKSASRQQEEWPGDPRKQRECSGLPQVMLGLVRLREEVHHAEGEGAFGGRGGLIMHNLRGLPSCLCADLDNAVKGEHPVGAQIVVLANGLLVANDLQGMGRATIGASNALGQLWVLLDWVAAQPSKRRLSRNGIPDAALNAQQYHEGWHLLS